MVKGKNETVSLNREVGVGSIDWEWMTGRSQGLEGLEVWEETQKYPFGG